MTKHQSLTMLKRLRAIMLMRPSRRPDWFDACNSGICDAFTELTHHELGKEYSIRELYFNHVQTWPHYSGYDSFYVPDPSGKSPVAAYMDSKNLYDRRSAYNRLRYDLLDHIIKCEEAQ